MIDVIILAGGFGTRLKEVVPQVPKPLAPIRGVPFLNILLSRLLSSVPIHKIIFALGHRSQEIFDHLQNSSFSVPISFSFEHTPLGTGGALKRALEWCNSDEVLICNGDSLLDFSFPLFYQAHKEKKARATIACLPLFDEGQEVGKVCMNPHTHQILSFSEKAVPIPLFASQEESLSLCSNAGLYLMDIAVTDHLPHKDRFSLEIDVFPSWAEQRAPFYGHLCRGFFIDIGTPETYRIAQELPLLQCAQSIPCVS